MKKAIKKVFRQPPTELDLLKQRWRDVRFEEMPDAIARMPIEWVRKAIKMTERGETVFVPCAPVTSTRRDGYGHGDSMREWDGDSFH